MTARYRLDQKLGAGAMGVVYRAFDTHLERPVAVKILDPAVLQAGGAAGMLREARAASALNHPNIATVYEVAEHDGQPCIVMEYVEGTPLDRAIPPSGLRSELVVRYGMQIAEALAHAHARGIVHRDLKSANIIVTADGRAKVLDFGLAHRLRESQHGAATEVAVPEPPAAAGTLAFMSPDVLDGHAPDSADDLWALGVVLYEMAGGELPFRGVTRWQLISSILRDDPSPLPAAIVPGLRAVILRSLAKERAARYQHAEEVHAALQAVQAGDNRPTTGKEAILYRRSRKAVMFGAAALGLLAMFATWTFFANPSPAPVSAAAPVAVAVLPFANPDGDSELEYLTDGITETVISSLSGVPGKLRVMSLNAVQPYRAQRADARVVGQTLNVAAVLYGSVVQRNGVVSVAVELVSATDQHRIWGDTYHKTTQDLMAMQQEIAGRISAALQVRLSGDEQQALRKHYPSNAEAYQLFLKGQWHWNRSTPRDYRRSLDYFQQAIKRDATYALAHAGLARVLSTMTYEGLLPPSTYREVQAAASTALSLDSTLGSPHESLAEAKFAYEWNWQAAEIEFRSALTLSPGDDAVHRYYGVFLRTQGRWDEAIAAMKQAISLNPLSADTSKALGATYFWARQYDRAIEQYLGTLRLDPTHAQTHDLLADAYAAKGMYRDALESRRTYLRYEGALEEVELLGTDDSEAGYRTGMRALHTSYLKALQKASSTIQYVSPMEFALIYIALGDSDRAFARLEEAFGERAPWLSSMAADPAFDPVRSDPRFGALVARVGIPYRQRSTTNP